MFKNPGGSTPSANFIRCSMLNGVCSDGLSTTVFPVASAGATFQMAIMRG